jgi:hypothetical protein
MPEDTPQQIPEGQIERLARKAAKTMATDMLNDMAEDAGFKDFGDMKGWLKQARKAGTREPEPPEPAADVATQIKAAVDKAVKEVTDRLTAEHKTATDRLTADHESAQQRARAERLFVEGGVKPADLPYAMSRFVAHVKTLDDAALEKFDEAAFLATLKTEAPYVFTGAPAPATPPAPVSTAPPGGGPAAPPSGGPQPFNALKATKDQIAERMRQIRAMPHVPAQAPAPPPPPASA